MLPRIGLIKPASTVGLSLAIPVPLALMVTFCEKPVFGSASLSLASSVGVSFVVNGMFMLVGTMNLTL